MKKELVEEALTNIDDRYIEEALTYKKSKIINFPRTTSKLVKAATVTLAVLAVGSATVYAGAKVYKKVTFTDNSMIMGNPDLVDEEDLEYEDADIDDVATDQSYWDGVESLGTVRGDDSVKWALKHDELVQGDHYTRYTYYNYKDAAEDAGMSVWFDPFPGELTSAEYSYCLYDDGENNEYKSIFVNATYNGHGFSIMQDKRAAFVKDEDIYFRVVMENVQNERTYTNKNGDVFTLADEVREDNSDRKIVMTHTIVTDSGNLGDFSFDDMTEEDIHYILDQIKLQK